MLEPEMTAFCEKFNQHLLAERVMIQGSRHIYANSQIQAMNEVVSRIDPKNVKQQDLNDIIKIAAASNFKNKSFWPALETLLKGILPYLQKEQSASPEDEMYAQIQRMIGMNIKGKTLQQQTKDLVNNRHQLFEFLKGHPNYIKKLAVDSLESAEMILGSRLGYILSDKDIVDVLLAHRDKQFIAAHVNPLEFYNRVEKLLAATERSLTTLSPDLKAKLITSSKYKLIYDQYAGRPQPRMHDFQRQRVESPAVQLARNANVNYYEEFKFIGPLSTPDEIKRVLADAEEIIKESDDPGDKAKLKLIADARIVLLDVEAKKIHDEKFARKADYKADSHVQGHDPAREIYEKAKKANYDYYQILGVNQNASPEEITRKYKDKLRAWNMIIAGAQGVDKKVEVVVGNNEKQSLPINEALALIKDAKEILCDPQLKARYDAAWKQKFKQPDQQRGLNP